MVWHLWRSRILLLVGTALGSAPALACSGCRAAVAAAVWGDGLAGRLAALLLPLLLIALIAWGLERGRGQPWKRTRGR